MIYRIVERLMVLDEIIHYHNMEIFFLYPVHVYMEELQEALYCAVTTAFGFWLRETVLVCIVVGFLGKFVPKTFLEFRFDTFNIISITVYFFK